MNSIQFDIDTLRGLIFLRVLLVQSLDSYFLPTPTAESDVTSQATSITK